MGVSPLSDLELERLLVEAGGDPERLPAEHRERARRLLATHTNLAALVRACGLG